MARQPIGSYPELSVVIAPSREIGGQIISLDWKSFVNGGYIVRARVHDPYLSLIRQLTNENSFLKNARQGPTEMKFSINWRETPDRKTTTRSAYISDIHIYGTAEDAGFEFVAVDPPSWWLNGGNSDGRVYRGNIKSVIENVVKDYAPGIKAEVSETNDASNGTWPMFRQDPKTFIQSLLEWSCSVTNKKTNWLVASVDNKIIIKEQNELSSGNIVNYQGSFQGQKNEILSFDMLSSAFVTPMQNKLTTQGLSATTGKFLDFETEKDKSQISDRNTGNKLNAKIDQRFGFKKPEPGTNDWSTSVMSVPEFSGGELGVKYEDYFEGRARNFYMGMLPMIMRCKITVRGEYLLDDSSKLGASTVNINWVDSEGEPFFLGGKWLLHGFHHYIVRGISKGNVSGTDWQTDVYLYRIDYDANAKPL